MLDLDIILRIPDDYCQGYDPARYDPPDESELDDNGANSRLRTRTKSSALDFGKRNSKLWTMVPRGL